MYKEITIIDTLGTKSIKDSLFGTSNRYKTMINVPIEGSNAKYELQAGTITRSNLEFPVFEAVSYTHLTLPTILLV